MSKHKTDEIWKPIRGFDGMYDVSNYGRVRSNSRIVRHNLGGDKRLNERIVSKLITVNGYCQVFLYKNGKRSVRLVHRLVLQAFVGECPVGMEVRHLNSVRTDNRLCNLAYGTHSDNVIDTIKLGRNGNQKLNPELVVTIRKRLDDGELVKDLASEYNVSTRAISKVKNRISYAWM